MKKPPVGQTEINGSKYIRVVAPAGFEGVATRRARYFPTKNAADEFRWKLKRWKAEKKAPTVTLEFDKDDQRWIAFLHNALGEDLSILPDVVEHWKRTGKAIAAKVTVGDAVDRFLKDRETKLKAKTLSNVRFWLRQFKSRFEDQQISHIIPGDIRAFMESFDHPMSQRNARKEISPLFKWAIEKRWLIVNPLIEISRPEAGKTEPEIYQVGAFEAMLYTANKRTLAFVAISGFAGLRTAELLVEREGDEVLQWPDLDFENRRITVRPEVSKGGARRRYVPMCDALIAWLEPIRQTEGKVVALSQSSFRKALSEVFELSEVNSVDNGLRHSFASYWLAEHSKLGVGQLALHMGNSEAIAKKHYIEVLTAEQGKAWFSITPPWI
jgi:integrase